MHNHWILIQTIGVKSNRDGIGTRIKIVGESGLRAVQSRHHCWKLCKFFRPKRSISGWAKTPRSRRLNCAGPRQNPDAAKRQSGSDIEDHRRVTHESSSLAFGSDGRPPWLAGAETLRRDRSATPLGIDTIGPWRHGGAEQALGPLEAAHPDCADVVLDRARLQAAKGEESAEDDIRALHQVEASRRARLGLLLAVPAGSGRVPASGRPFDNGLQLRSKTIPWRWRSRGKFST